MNTNLVLLLSLFVLLWHHVHSQPRRVDSNQYTHTDEDGGTLHRVRLYFKNLAKRFSNPTPSLTIPLQRVKRSQVNFLLNRCVSDSSCVDSDFGQNVTTDLIRCDISSGLCVCNECFVRLNNTCQVITPLCRNYVKENQQCVDFRKSQKTALLLSMFLSSVGAANFYIGDYLLGGLQLGFLLVSIAVACAAICIPVCVLFKLDADYAETIFVDWFCCVSITAVIVIVIPLSVVAIWWVTDIAVFAYNGRNDLNGCPLIADL